jgi:hypothetical protein
MAEAYLDSCSRMSLPPLDRVVDALDACLQTGALSLRGSNTVARLGDADAEALAECLPASRCCALDLSNNSLTDTGAAALASDGRCASLVVLNLGENAIGWGGARSLASGLAACAALEELVLDANPLGELGGAAIAGLVECLPSLTQLRLCRCELGIDAIIALCASLARTASLRLLDLSEPLLTSRNEEATSHIARALTGNATLARLVLRKHPCMSDTSTEALCDALLDNAVLSELDLSYNALGPPSGELLGAALVRGCSLGVLQLAGCRLGTAGALALASALGSGLCPLRHLDLRSNGVGAEGVVALCSALASPHCTLQTLLLWGNPGLGGGAGAEALAQLMASQALRTALDVAVTRVDGLAQVSELKA